MYNAISYVLIHTYDCITNYILCTLIIIEYVYIAICTCCTFAVSFGVHYNYIYSILIELMMV